ncbi:MAG: hypothetical protein RSF81_04820 [Oscillospiraceae bacterium]
MIVPNGVKIKDFVTKYTTVDMPIPYKSLNIQLIKMRDVFSFLECYDILTIEKNKIADVKIIQMNYLQFIFNLLFNDKTWVDKFINIITISFGLEYNNNLFIDKYAKGAILCQQIDEQTSIFFFNGYDIKFIVERDIPTLVINNVEISAKEFDEIRKLIMYSNVIDYDDNEMSEDFKKVVNSYYKIKNKGLKVLTIEDKINVVMAQSSYTKEQILEMTYRNFEGVFNIAVEKTEYIVNKIAEIQGRTKQPIEHWIYKKDKSKYSHIFSDADKYIDEIAGKH